MTPAQLKALLLGLFFTTFAALGITGVVSYRHMAAKLATVEQDASMAKAIANENKVLYDSLSKAILQRDTTVAGIRAGVVATKNRLDEAKHEDPEAGRYLDAPIPDSVRRAYTKPGQAKP